MKAEIILKFITVGIGFATFIFSLIKYIQTNKKNRRLETLKYMSQIRNEIWEVSAYKSLSSVKDKHKIRAIRQKLEYVAMAVNHDVAEKDVVKKLSGKWYCSAVDMLKLADQKRIASEMKNETVVQKDNVKDKSDSWQEIERLYCELKCDITKRK